MIFTFAVAHLAYRHGQTVGLPSGCQWVPGQGLLAAGGPGVQLFAMVSPSSVVSNALPLESATLVENGLSAELGESNPNRG